MDKKGDHVVVIGDLNKFIHKQQVISFFSKLFLRELILDKHVTEGQATTRSNKKNQTIDKPWEYSGLAIK